MNAVRIGLYTQQQVTGFMAWPLTAPSVPGQFMLTLGNAYTYRVLAVTVLNSGVEWITGNAGFASLGLNISDTVLAGGGELAELNVPAAWYS